MKAAHRMNRRSIFRTILFAVLLGATGLLFGCATEPEETIDHQPGKDCPQRVPGTGSDGGIGGTGIEGDVADPDGGIGGTGAKDDPCASDTQVN
ncbi:hypothetical protein EOI86_05915 [Hwanghaeella grinnelliae]|uniref:Uncharacterized protein n=1 Tax=Hwanghaeella grinnelliae TaxID=2500179 RepID=A0A437QWI2_9PROT|nr:hypothetical protein [Hwanghaeella grinnelliae]RVU38803.1 hypothetical protein EOI86_05915 [Hwanghaeella grinnelliae]